MAAVVLDVVSSSGSSGNIRRWRVESRVGIPLITPKVPDDISPNTGITEGLIRLVSTECYRGVVKQGIGKAAILGDECNRLGFGRVGLGLPYPTEDFQL